MINKNKQFDMDRIEKLELKKSYLFDVFVQYNKNNFAAKLHLSPKKITLSWEEIEGEDAPTVSRKNLEQLTCTTASEKTFILMHLCCIQRSIKSISYISQKDNKKIKFFENVFEVDHVFFAPSNLYRKDAVVSISIYSSTIGRWVGQTMNQESIVKNYQKNRLAFDDPKRLLEFTTNIKGIGDICVEYYVLKYDSLQNFRLGINYSPILSLLLKEPIEISKLNINYQKLYSLIAFLIGGDFSVDQVEVIITSGPSFNEGTLYYASKKIRLKGDQNSELNEILFPLGKDLKSNPLNLPNLPLSVFSSYMSLPPNECNYFQQYFQCKRMKNREEKFLGFFRILESLKNVHEFYLTIPSSLKRKWKFKKNDIAKIHKMKDDISLSVNYSISKFEIEEGSKFIETLLVLALFEKIGIDLSTSSQIIHRVSGYEIIAIRDNDRMI